MRLVVMTNVPNKEHRPRACIVTSYSARFQRLLDIYLKERYEGGTLADIIRIPAGARQLAPHKKMQGTILDWLEESIKEHHVYKVILMITATEGETMEESKKVLLEIKGIVERRLAERRLGKIPVDLLAVRGEGLYSLEKEKKA